jgi:hypothetical protein
VSEKYDIKKEHRALYAPNARDFSVVDVPPLRYLAVDGHGDPNTSSSYAAAVELLYSSVYRLKFASKAAGQDFVVGPLEGLWRAEDPSAFISRAKSEWDWTMMISLPSWVAVGDLSGARVLSLRDGLSVQILHVGSYDDEGPVLARMHSSFMPAQGFTFNGDHHEIYLSDPRRTEPSKLRTVLRQPVRAV